MAPRVDKARGREVWVMFKRQGVVVARLLGVMVKVMA